MTDADLLAAAAAKLREVAGSTSSPSAAWHSLEHDDGGLVRAEIQHHTWTVAKTDYEPDAAFIATMTPRLGLLLAALLDAERSRVAFGWELGETPQTSPHALATARAVLGAEAAG